VTLLLLSFLFLFFFFFSLFLRNGSISAILEVPLVPTTRKIFLPISDIDSIFISDDENHAKVFEGVESIHFLDVEFANDEVIGPALMQMGMNERISLCLIEFFSSQISLIRFSDFVFSEVLEGNVSFVPDFVGVKKVSENVKQSAVDIMSGV
jgi:hypothetical protein